MPERSFGRTVRYRRTKLGLSQAKLGELVGRSPATIRAWERDSSQPNDPKILSALAAILALDERQLFERAGVDVPEVEESHTIEQALATLTPSEQAIDDHELVQSEEAAMPEDGESEMDGQTVSENRDPHEGRPERVGPVLVSSQSGPAFVTPSEPLPVTPPTPSLADTSYMEDRSQRQLYRVRTMATLVALLALVIAFIWAFGESLGALGAWWDDFFSNLRL